MKKVITPRDSYRILSNGPLLLLVTMGQGSAGARPEVSTIAWSTPIDFDPPRLAVIIDSTHRTWHNAKETGECTLNVVSRSLLPQAVYAGTVSSREHDKIVETGLVTIAGSLIRTPILPQCLANIECRVLAMTEETGFVLLEPLAALADEAAYFSGWKMEAGIYPVQHLGGERFQCGAEVLIQPAIQLWPVALT
jgi:flavin reductase (DIM6/NTAB) family NADH-FMN oxidoreductase RutF